MLALEENGGFFSGNNAGFRLALQDNDCRAFWLLNNATEPAPDALNAPRERFNQLQSAGFCGSTLCYAHEPDIAQCAGDCTLAPLTGADLPARRRTCLSRDFQGGRTASTT